MSEAVWATVSAPDLHDQPGVDAVRRVGRRLGQGQRPSSVEETSQGPLGQVDGDRAGIVGGLGADALLQRGDEDEGLEGRPGWRRPWVARLN